MPYAVVTGPTSGIGRSFTESLAAQGHDLLLVSRDAQRLEGVAGEIRARHGIDVRFVVADLSVREEIARIAGILRSEKVDVLVNNAGFGIKGGVLDTSIDDEQRMLDVLTTAVLQLTHAVLPGMVERGRGYVFTVSSVAGWITGGTYSAAKAWATVFTESLAVELSGTDVRVVAVCPGFTRTEFHQRAEMDMESVSDWMWLDTQQVVDQAFRDARSGRVISVAGPQYKALSALLRVLPRPLVRRATGVRQSSARFPQAR